MTTTPTTAGTPPPGDQPDRATRAAAGRVLTRDAANIWLTDATVADIGQAVAVSINHYRREHQQQPTWAQALAGVDPELLTPLAVAAARVAAAARGLAAGPADPADEPPQTHRMDHLLHQDPIPTGRIPRTRLAHRHRATPPGQPTHRAGTRGHQAETVSTAQPLGLHLSGITASPSIDAHPGPTNRIESPEPCRAGAPIGQRPAAGSRSGYRPVNDLPDDEFRDIVDSLRLDLDTSAIETDERSDRYIRELARLLLTNPEAFDQLTLTFLMGRVHKDADIGVAKQIVETTGSLVDILDNTIQDWTDT